MATLTDQIRAALGASDGLTAAQLVEVLPEGTSKKDVSALLSQRKSAGEFGSRMEDRMLVYFIAGKAPAGEAASAAEPPAASRQPPAASRQPPAASRPANPRPKAKREVVALRRDFAAASESREKVLKALQFAHGTACDALEIYIQSVADAGIYRSLVEARDQARRALDALLEGMK
ncbi:MAG: hypothetical protein AB1832_01040 [Pseudomonadota bacterium]